MLDIFKEWIGSIVAVAILGILVRLIVPNSNIKKYVYTLLGILTVMVVLKPLLNTSNIEKIVLDATKSINNSNVNYDNIDFSSYKKVSEDNIKEEFKAKLEENIVENIKKIDDSSISVKIEITEDYNIYRIIIGYSGQKVEEIKQYISSTYDISPNNIVINK